MNLFFITWDISPVLFHVGNISIRWYGVLFALSFILGYFILKKMFEKEQVPVGYLDKLSLYVFLGLLIGLRLGHCLFYEPSYYLARPWEIILPFQFPNGFFDFASWKFTGFQGLASHGGAIGLLFSIYLYQRATRLPYLWVLDRLVIIVAMGGLFIRLGNLMNSEIYGHVTSLPWGFIFVRAGEVLPKHPTQLYEGISYFLLSLGLLYYYYKKSGKPKEGVIFGTFLSVLFLLRFIIEFFKENQVEFEQNMTLNMGQILSIPFIIIGIVILVFAFSGKLKSQQLDLKKLKPLKENSKKK